MTVINLSDVGVFSCTLTVAEARELIDGEMTLPDDMATVLDSAQSTVGSKELPKAYLVLEIIPDAPGADDETSAA